MVLELVGSVRSSTAMLRGVGDDIVTRAALAGGDGKMAGAGLGEVTLGLLEGGTGRSGSALSRGSLLSLSSEEQSFSEGWACWYRLLGL